MRRSLPWGSAAIVLLSACADMPSAPDASLQPQAAVSAAAPVYLVTFRDDVPVDATTTELAQRHGLGVRAVRHFAARGFTAVVPDARVAALRADPRVLIVERDGPVSLVKPIIEKRPGGGGGGGQTTPWGITRVGGAGDGTGRTAWVIDTGIDLDHPDLNTSRNCHVAFTGNTPDDGNGHGTHVAGTIGAINNNIGVVGVAANAYVCSVRVLNAAGSGTWSAIVAGVNHVAANGASGEVANMSLGGSGSNATLEKAVADAAKQGIAFVLAAGNDGSFAGYFTPARLDATHVYTISAIDSKGCMPSWSNWGNPPVDYAAPGVSVLSTYRGGRTATMSGTSMAAPHAAGVLLLGSARTSGSASCDPDGKPDPIVSR